MNEDQKKIEKAFGKELLKQFPLPYQHMTQVKQSKYKLPFIDSEFHDGAKNIPFVFYKSLSRVLETPIIPSDESE